MRIAFRMKLLKRLERLQSTGRKQHLAIYGYAVRFFQYNCSLMPFFEVEDSRTLDVAYDMDLIRVSWQVQVTEVCLDFHCYVDSYIILVMLGKTYDYLFLSMGFFA